MRSAPSGAAVPKTLSDAVWISEVRETLATARQQRAQLLGEPPVEIPLLRRGRRNCPSGETRAEACAEETCVDSTVPGPQRPCTVGMGQRYWPLGSWQVESPPRGVGQSSHLSPQPSKLGALGHEDSKRGRADPQRAMARRAGEHQADENCKEPFPRLPAQPRTAREPRNRNAPEVLLPAVHIVEAPTSLAVELEGGPVQIPAHTWLVLDLADPSCDAASETRLSATLGGGSISRTNLGLVKAVPPDRLHREAAEANFQRAARGSSLFALQHAALALQLLGQCNRNVPLPYLTQLPPSPSIEELNARLHRMGNLVTSRADKVKHRAEVAVINGAHNAPPPEIDTGSRGGARSLLWKGCHAWKEFLQFARHRFGNTVRAWFRMDLQEKLILTEKEFIRGCEEIGFRGNIPALWRYADANRCGQVQLWEIDPNAAMQLASFRNFVVEKLDCEDANAFYILDQNQSNRLYKAEFIQRLHSLGYESDLAVLFDLLDRDGYGFMVERDLNFLRHWKPPPYLFCKPNHEAVQRLREAFLKVHGSPLFRTWRKVLDRPGSMRITWNTFVNACSSASMAKQSGAPKTEEQISAVWKALDTECSGWIRLREFDPPCFEVYSSFKRWAESLHGSALRAFREIDAATNGNGKLAERELRKVVQDRGGWNGDVGFLFECLDWNNSGRIVEQDVVFLDHWDLDTEEWEAKVRKWNCRPRAGLRPKQGLETM